MGEQKVTRKNHPLLVKARQEGYQQGYRAGRKKAHQATIDACNHSIQTTKKHYQFIIDSLDKATNNQFTDVVLIYDPESLTFDYDEGWTTKLELGVSYSHSGSGHYESREFPPCCEMTIEKLLEVYNELLARMIKNHSREVENG